MGDTLQYRFNQVTLQLARLSRELEYLAEIRKEQAEVILHLSTQNERYKAKLERIEARPRRGL